MITMTEKEAVDLKVSFIKSMAGVFVLGVIVGLILAEVLA